MKESSRGMDWGSWLERKSVRPVCGSRYRTKLFEGTIEGFVLIMTEILIL